MAKISNTNPKINIEWFGKFCGTIHTTSVVEKKMPSWMEMIPFEKESTGLPPCYELDTKPCIYDLVYEDNESRRLFRTAYKRLKPTTWLEQMYRGTHIYILSYKACAVDVSPNIAPIKQCLVLVNPRANYRCVTNPKRSRKAIELAVLEESADEFESPKKNQTKSASPVKPSSVFSGPLPPSPLRPFQLASSSPRSRTADKENVHPTVLNTITPTLPQRNLAIGLKSSPEKVKMDRPAMVKCSKLVRKFQFQSPKRSLTQCNRSVVRMR